MYFGRHIYFRHNSGDLTYRGANCKWVGSCSCLNYRLRTMTLQKYEHMGVWGRKYGELFVNPQTSHPLNISPKVDYVLNQWTALLLSVNSNLPCSFINNFINILFQLNTETRLKTLPDGPEITARSLWEENGAVVMIVRRPGWKFCREVGFN